MQTLERDVTTVDIAGEDDIVAARQRAREYAKRLGFGIVDQSRIATAVSEGDHWVVDIPGVGTTHADNVSEIEDMAIDLVTAMTHTARQDVHVQVRIV